MSSAAPRVAWVLSGSRIKASSRLQGFRVHEELLRQGWTSEIVVDRFGACKTARSRAFLRAAFRVLRGGYTHLIVEGPQWPAVQLAMLARKAGLTVLAVRCDRYPLAYDRYFDRTILPTEDLRADLQVQKAAVIPDMIEVPEARCKTDYAAHGRPLRAVWVGHGSYAEFIRAFVADQQQRLGEGFEFITISSGPGFTRPWSEATVVDDILSADLAFIPVPDGEWFKGKSSNRLAMMFSLGMPTVATPLNAYQELGRHDENLLFARSPEQFAEQLQRLRDPALRERLGRAGRASLDGSLSPRRVAMQWGDAIRATQAEPGASHWAGRLLRRCAALFQSRRRV